MQSSEIFAASAQLFGRNLHLDHHLEVAIQEKKQLNDMDEATKTNALLVSLNSYPLFRLHNPYTPVVVESMYL